MNNDKHKYFQEQWGILDSLTYRDESYPDDFYQVLECLDLVMRVYSGEKMGTSGVQEMSTLMALFVLDPMLLHFMPKSAYAFFKAILNPKNKYDIFSESKIGYGSIFRTYSDLRTYLIDNKERVTDVYKRLIDNNMMKELEEKYKK